MRSAAAPTRPPMAAEAAGLLHSVPAGAAISRHPRNRARSRAWASGSRAAAGGTLAPAPSDARSVSRRTGSLDRVAPQLTPEP